jgi:hypothetical protein
LESAVVGVDVLNEPVWMHDEFYREAVDVLREGVDGFGNLLVFLQPSPFSNTPSMDAFKGIFSFLFCI